MVDVTSLSPGLRAFAAGAPSLKTKLRELYKKVHPDLFHDYHPARVRFLAPSAQWLPGQS